MLEWWNAFSAQQQIFATFAIPATVILIIQTLLLIIGGDFSGHGDIDADISTDFDTDTDGDGIADAHSVFDHDGDADHDGNIHFTGIKLFTLRSIVAFFAVGGWLGVVMCESGAGLPLSILTAAAGGVAAMFFVALTLKWMMSMQENGNADYGSAVGKTAEVYIKIPADKSGKGKISVMVSSQLIEADAITEEAEAIMPRTKVKILSIADGSTFVVASCK